MIKSKKASECQKNLDFNPETPWPSLLPLYGFGNELLCGFHRHTTPEESVIILEGESLPQIIRSLYPQLSFPELSRLSAKLSHPNFDHHSENSSLRNQLWSLYGYQPRENLFLVAEKVTQLPLDIQHWMAQKKMSPQDLAALRSLDNLSILEDYWDALLLANPSKSEGTRALENLVELLLMGHQKDDILKPTPSWISHLHSLRYPMSLQQDNQNEQKIRALSWSSKWGARWTRRGDRSGVELKLFFTHPEELKGALVRLEKVSKELDNTPSLEDLWSKN